MIEDHKGQKAIDLEAFSKGDTEENQFEARASGAKIVCWYQRLPFPVS